MVDRKARKKLLAIAGVSLTLANPLRPDSFGTQRQPRQLSKTNGPVLTIADSGALTVVASAGGYYLVAHNEWVALAGSSATGTFQSQIVCTNSGGQAAFTGTATNLSSAQGTVPAAPLPQAINCMTGTITYHLVMNSPTGSATVGYEYAVYQIQ